MGLLMANYIKRLYLKIWNMPIWASIKLFEDAEKASIRNQYEIKKPRIDKLLSLMVPLLLAGPASLVSRPTSFARG